MEYQKWRWPWVTPSAEFSVTFLDEATGRQICLTRDSRRLPRFVRCRASLPALSLLHSVPTAANCGGHHVHDQTAAVVRQQMNCKIRVRIFHSPSPNGGNAPRGREFCSDVQAFTIRGDKDRPVHAERPD